MILCKQSLYLRKKNIIAANLSHPNNYCLYFLKTKIKSVSNYYKLLIFSIFSMLLLLLILKLKNLDTMLYNFCHNPVSVTGFFIFVIIFWCMDLNASPMSGIQTFYDHFFCFTLRLILSQFTNKFLIICKSGLSRLKILIL